MEMEIQALGQPGFHDHEGGAGRAWGSWDECGWGVWGGEGREWLVVVIMGLMPQW